MIEYKYKKIENKFTENGHTMFETDVLARLQRLAYLEEQIKQGQLLPKHLVSKSFTLLEMREIYSDGMSNVDNCGEICEEADKDFNDNIDFIISQRNNVC